MIKILLYPFSIIYALIAEIRNWLYDVGLLKTTHFDIPIICVGNITVGGTGKTPHTEYLVHLLRREYKIAVLSRGYGRTSKGFHWVEKNSNSSEVGDEPLQMKRKFKKELFAVCENRVAGVKRILAEHPDVDLILLDDAFQHRAIAPSLKVLLVDYNRQIMNDMVMPAGRMRELAYQHKRADIVVFTKCPMSLSGADKAKLRFRLKKRAHQQVFFSCMDYGKPRKLIDKSKLSISLFSQAIMLTGIARPEPFKKYLEEHLFVAKELIFPDHHNYSDDDVERISIAAEKNKKMPIITTEKDAARLASIDIPLDLKDRIYYVPIVVKFLTQESGYHDFNTNILNHVATHSRNSKIYPIEN
ncbi:MAG: tetraacyldisaccharide 4'-kinase [Mangrovibacterium sp.]